MSAQTAQRLQAGSISSWTANVAVFNFWEGFYTSLSRRAAETLSFEDRTMVTVKYDPLNLQGRWTGSRYALEAESGCVRFSAELDQMSSLVMFGFHAVGLKRVVSSDERMLLVGWLHIDEVGEGYRLESKPAIDDLVTGTHSAISERELFAHSEDFAAWVVDELTTRRANLLKNITTSQ